MQAFVIDISDTLILVQVIDDFHTDGRLLIRIADITNIEATATDEMHRRMLVEEGDFEQIDFSPSKPISSYAAFLRSLPENEIVILEDELTEEPEFLIGTILYVDDRCVSIRFFTGAAVWEDEPSEIELERITSCQIGSNYTNYYQRHFSRCETD